MSTETVTEARHERRRAGNPEFYRRYEYGELYSDEIVTLSQVRKERNPVVDELAADVLNNGLINGLDIARVTPDLFEEYLRFVHDTWGDGAEARDFDTVLNDDGTHNLLIAGHSRLHAIHTNEADGRCEQHPIPVKFHEVSSVWDIIRLQLGENLHTAPSQERQAIALVEAYRWGESTGMWGSVDDFLGGVDEEAGKSLNVGKGFMSQAMLFERLPAQIRNYVLAGPIHFTVGIEMARATPALKSMLESKLGTVDSDVLDELIKQELVILCNNIQQGGANGAQLNSTAAKAKVKGMREHWKKQSALLDKPAKDEGVFELEFASPDDQARKMLNDQKDTIRSQLTALANKDSEHVQTTILLADGIVGDDFVQRCLERQVADSERAVREGRAKLRRDGRRVVDSYLLDAELPS